MAQSVAERPQLVAPRSSTTTDNPFGGELARRPTSSTGLVAVEQERAIAEVKAQLIIAHQIPRDPVRATDLILNDCTRPTLAQKALYSYSRGGADISGPSIRLMEPVAQRWGNIDSGIKEIARHDGYSDCLAYAWDLETNFRDRREFQVKHWRDTKQGGYPLTDERDIYELIANMGQRRKRACLLAVIPGDVVEAAVAQCERTMESSADVTPEGIQKLVAAFATLGVEPHQIEARIQRRLDTIRPAQVVMLRKVYNSISDGMSTPADWFGEAAMTEATQSGQAEAATQPARGEGEGGPRRRGRPPGPRRQQPSSGEGRADPGTGGDAGAGEQKGSEPIKTDQNSEPGNSPGNSPPASQQPGRRVNFEV